MMLPPASAAAAGRAQLRPHPPPKKQQNFQHILPNHNGNHAMQHNTIASLSNSNLVSKPISHLLSSPSSSPSLPSSPLALMTPLMTSMLPQLKSAAVAAPVVPTSPTQQKPNSHQKHQKSNKKHAPSRISSQIESAHHPSHDHANNNNNELDEKDRDKSKDMDRERDHKDRDVKDMNVLHISSLDSDVSPPLPPAVHIDGDESIGAIASVFAQGTSLPGSPLSDVQGLAGHGAVNATSFSFLTPTLQINSAVPSANSSVANTPQHSTQHSFTPLNINNTNNSNSNNNSNNNINNNTSNNVTTTSSTSASPSPSSPRVERAPVVLPPPASSHAAAATAAEPLCAVSMDSRQWAMLLNRYRKNEEKDKEKEGDKEKTGDAAPPSLGSSPSLTSSAAPSVNPETQALQDELQRLRALIALQNMNKTHAAQNNTNTPSADHTASSPKHAMSINGSPPVPMTQTPTTLSVPPLSIPSPSITASPSAGLSWSTAFAALNNSFLSPAPSPDPPPSSLPIPPSSSSASTASPAPTFYSSPPSAIVATDGLASPSEMRTIYRAVRGGNMTVAMPGKQSPMIQHDSTPTSTALQSLSNPTPLPPSPCPVPPSPAPSSVALSSPFSSSLTITTPQPDMLFPASSSPVYSLADSQSSPPPPPDFASHDDSEIEEESFLYQNEDEAELLAMQEVENAIYRDSVTTAPIEDESHLADESPSTPPETPHSIPPSAAAPSPPLKRLPRRKSHPAKCTNPLCTERSKAWDKERNEYELRIEKMQQQIASMQQSFQKHHKIVRSLESKYRRDVSNRDARIRELLRLVPKDAVSSLPLEEDVSISPDIMEGSDARNANNNHNNNNNNHNGGVSPVHKNKRKMNADQHIQTKLQASDRDKFDVRDSSTASPHHGLSSFSPSSPFPPPSISLPPRSVLLSSAITPSPRTRSNTMPSTPPAHALWKRRNSQSGQKGKEREKLTDNNVKESSQSKTPNPDKSATLNSSGNIPSLPTASNTSSSSIPLLLSSRATAVHSWSAGHVHLDEKVSADDEHLLGNSLVVSGSAAHMGKHGKKEMKKERRPSGVDKEKEKEREKLPIHPESDAASRVDAESQHKDRDVL